jgi:hypothetical protein
LRVTDINKSDDILQVAETTSEHTTPTVFPDAEIHSEDDGNLDNMLGGKRMNDLPIHNDIGNLWSQMVDGDCLEEATHNQSTLEMLLQKQIWWNAEHRLGWERMAAQREQVAAQWEKVAAQREQVAAQWAQWAAESVDGSK